MDELNQIRERTSIVDLISETVPLKKAGRNFKGLCPFHQEKTPSFVVSPERAIWHCFGCGKGGDCFTFLMELEHLEFPEALKILADRAGIKLVKRSDSSREVRLKERLLELHALANEFYHYLLTKHAVGERARRYLKERGMTDALIKTFSLGFAPQAWDNLGKFLRKKGFTPQELEVSGLSLRGRSGWFDRFRDRIIFSLKNQRGNTVAFSGRLLVAKADTAKYINSPETPLYVKGDQLYGLSITKDHIRKSGIAVVVEGEFDLISSYQAGVTNVVAIKGSALTEAQIRLIKRFAERMVLALDKDVAGDAASRRGIELADQAGLEIRVVDIPSGKDPDEAARGNAHLWQKAVAAAGPVYDFIFTSAIARFGTSEAFAKKKVSDEVLPQLSKIVNPIVQAHYVKLLATKLEINEEKVSKALKNIKPQLGFTKKTLAVAPTPRTHTELIEEMILALVIQAADPPAALNLVSEQIDPSDLTDGIIRRIFMSLIDYLSAHEKLDVNELARGLPPELMPTLDRVYLIDLAKAGAGKYWEQEIRRTTSLLKQDSLRRKISGLATEVTAAEKRSDEASLKELNTQLNTATTALKRLS